MSLPYYAGDLVTLHLGDCLDVLRGMEAGSADAVVTDPPYGLEFMGREWDTFGRDTGNHRYREKPRFTADHMGKGFGALPNTFEAGHPFQQWCETWAAECLRVLKPGGHLLAFGGTRTYHRLACGIEDAGFEIRDSLHWIYAQGFPKSLNVGKDARFCRCDLQQLIYGNGGVLRMRQGVSDLSGLAEEGQVADMLEAVQRTGTGPGVGEVRPQGAASEERSSSDEKRSGESCLEGRRDAEASEGQLQRSALRPLSGGVPADGASGRLHHGAPASDGTVDRPTVAADGSCQPQGSQPVEQCAVEPGTVADEWRPQAGGSWPLCGRCGKPAVSPGLGTALKPAHEPIVLARKPLAAGTVAANVLEYGTGGINIDGCRIAGDVPTTTQGKSDSIYGGGKGFAPEGNQAFVPNDAGRWPPNVLLTHAADCIPAGMREVRSDGHHPASRGRGGLGASGHAGQEGLSERKSGTETVEAWDCVPGCPVGGLDAQSGTLTSGANPARRGSDKFRDAYGEFAGQRECAVHRGADTGGASRFFPVTTWDPERDLPFLYQAKASARERPRLEDGTAWPTVKPVALMRWLVRLVTPPGGLVVEPFAGTGTTGEACALEGFRCVMVEKDLVAAQLAVKRLSRSAQLTLDAVLNGV